MVACLLIIYRMLIAVASVLTEQMCYVNTGIAALCHQPRLLVISTVAALMCLHSQQLTIQHLVARSPHCM
jgi:hypothetical protein